MKHIDSLQPNTHYTQKMLTKSYYQLEAYSIAKDYFLKALEIDLDDYKSHIYIGHIQLKGNDLKRAMYHYTVGTYLGTEPRDDAYLGLGNVYYQMQFPTMVLDAYKKAVDENNNNYQALYALATFADAYYKDVTIGYGYYKTYLDKFKYRNTTYTNNVKKRLKEIKKALFLAEEDVK